MREVKILTKGYKRIIRLKNKKFKTLRVKSYISKRKLTNKNLKSKYRYDKFKKYWVLKQKKSTAIYFYFLKNMSNAYLLNAKYFIVKKYSLSTIKSIIRNMNYDIDRDLDYSINFRVFYLQKYYKKEEYYKIFAKYHFKLYEYDNPIEQFYSDTDIIKKKYKMKEISNRDYELINKFYKIGYILDIPKSNKITFRNIDYGREYDIK